MNKRFFIISFTLLAFPVMVWSQVRTGDAALRQAYNDSGRVISTGLRIMEVGRADSSNGNVGGYLADTLEFGVALYRYPTTGFFNYGIAVDTTSHGGKTPKTSVYITRHARGSSILGTDLQLTQYGAAQADTVLKIDSLNVVAFHSGWAVDTTLNIGLADSLHATVIADTAVDTVLDRLKYIKQLFRIQ